MNSDQEIKNVAFILKRIYKIKKVFLSNLLMNRKLILISFHVFSLCALMLGTATKIGHRLQTFFMIFFTALPLKNYRIHINAELSRQKEIIKLCPASSH